MLKPNPDIALAANLDSLANSPIFLIPLVIIAFFGLILALKYIRKKISNRTLAIEVREASKPSYWEPPIQITNQKPPTEFQHTIWDFSPPTLREVPLSENKRDWSLNVIQDIELRRLEELSFAYFLKKGMLAKAISRKDDGGIDIKLYQNSSYVPTTIVHCKSWNNKLVGTKEIRGFLWVMNYEKIARGIYLSAGEYTNDAKEFAKLNNITAITGKMLLMMITRLPEESQNQLLNLTFEDEFSVTSRSFQSEKNDLMLQ